MQEPALSILPVGSRDLLMCTRLLSSYFLSCAVGNQTQLFTQLGKYINTELYTQTFNVVWWISQSIVLGFNRVPSHKDSIPLSISITVHTKCILVQSLDHLEHS